MAAVCGPAGVLDFAAHAHGPDPAVDQRRRVEPRAGPGFDEPRGQRQPPEVLLRVLTGADPDLADPHRAVRLGVRPEGPHYAQLGELDTEQDRVDRAQVRALVGTGQLLR